MAKSKTTPTQSRALTRKAKSDMSPTGAEPLTPLEAALLTDLRLLIEQAREQVAQSVNTGLVMLYWNVGRRIGQDILKEQRAAYGQKIVVTMSRQLVAEFGPGFSKPNLLNMIRFVEVFPAEAIVYALSRQLSWTHFRRIIYLKDDLKRDFYAEMCRLEGWSTRALDEKINGLLYERTALAKKPAELIRKELDTLRETDRMTPDLVFRDPYILDFLKLPADYSEQELEAALLREIEQFLLELGESFCFVARQKRITIGRKDYKLDLLFYHRDLRRLVVVELKLEDFQPAHKGQTELYLRWLDKYARKPGEESPIGLILCAGAEAEEIELLQLAESGIRVAEYLTELPPREMLQKKLRQAIEMARARHFLPEEQETEGKPRA